MTQSGGRPDEQNKTMTAIGCAVCALAAIYWGSTGNPLLGIGMGGAAALQALVLVTGPARGRTWVWALIVPLTIATFLGLLGGVFL